MYFLWYLSFVFVFFGFLVPVRTDFYDYDDVHHTSTVDQLSDSLKSTESIEYSDDDYFNEPLLTKKESTTTTKTTPFFKKTRKSVVYYSTDHPRKNEDDKRAIKYETVTEATKSTVTDSTKPVVSIPTMLKSEISATQTSSSANTYSYIYFVPDRLDDEDSTAYIAKINRDRMMLKIFGASVILIMSTLTVVFIVIHILQKKKTRQGYRATANALLN